MGIEKTATGIQALETRGRLKPRERQLLILCNGQRSLQELVMLIGEGAVQMLGQLEAAELVRGVTAAATSAAAPQAARAPAVTPAAAPEDDLPPRARNRSLAAGKIYLIDVLQLQQDESANHLMTQLRRSESPQPIMELMLVALDLILERSGERYTERVAGRVFEIVPDEHLKAFIDLAMGMRIPLLDLLARRYQRCLPVPA